MKNTEMLLVEILRGEVDLTPVEADETITDETDRVHHQDDETIGTDPGIEVENDETVIGLEVRVTEADTKLGKTSKINNFQVKNVNTDKLVKILTY